MTEAQRLELEILWLFVRTVAADECQCGAPPNDNGDQCSACTALGLLRQFGRPVPPTPDEAQP